MAASFTGGGFCPFHHVPRWFSVSKNLTAPLRAPTETPFNFSEMKRKVDCERCLIIRRCRLTSLILSSLNGRKSPHPGAKSLWNVFPEEWRLLWWNVYICAFERGCSRTHRDATGCRGGKMIDGCSEILGFPRISVSQKLEHFSKSPVAII